MDAVGAGTHTCGCSPFLWPEGHQICGLTQPDAVACPGREWTLGFCRVVKLIGGRGVLGAQDPDGYAMREKACRLSQRALERQVARVCSSLVLLRRGEKMIQ